jgi:LmbE family N-acetylglucosaminyl deacetylase
MNLQIPTTYNDGLPQVDVLAIAAHPSAVEQTCAGTLVKMAELGYRTAVLDLTPGDVILPAEKESTLAQSEAAAKELLLAYRGNFWFTDGRLENTLALRMTVAGEIRRLRPKVVILPYWETRNPDHAVTCEIAYQSCFLAGLGRLDDNGEPHRPSTIVYAAAYANVKPSFVVDVAAQMARREAALACYGLTASPAAIAYAGSLVGTAYGEPFILKDPPRVENLMQLGVRSF